MVYRLHSGVTGNKIQKLKQKSINLTMAFMLAFTGLGATPLLWAQTATALSSSEVVYDALPSVTPSTNYVSLGYQATSTSEMGDLIHLGGTNRVLNTVTVTMSDWAKYSTYSSDASYNSANWSHPITLTVYGDSLAGDGTPDTILASKTQTFDIPWRPESDPSCGDTGNGKGWIEDGTCYDYSGIAFNITFDLSSLAVTLPDDIIVGVSYNTQSYGTSPLGVGGPYNSLNVAIPTNQTVSTGSDDDTDAIFWNTSHCAWYTDGGASGCGTFREDNNWAPYATVALQITATAPMPPSAPMNVRISDDGTNVPSGSYVNASFVPGYTVLNFDAVNGADKYITEVTYPGGSKNLWNSYNNTWLIKNGVPSQGEFTSHGEGEYSYRVKARSATNGLWSPWSAAIQLNYDITRSTIEVLNPLTDYEVLSDSDSIEVKATDNIALKKVTANIYTSAGTLIDSNSTSTSATEYTMSVSLTGLADGDYYVKTNSQDAAGNPLAHTITRYFTIDSTGPTIGDTSTGVIPMYTGDKVTLDPEATDSHGPVTYSWSVSDKLLLNDPKDSLDGETLRIGPTKKGSYEAVVVATDAIGNTSTKIYEITVLTPAVAEQSNQNPQTLGATTGGGNSSSNSNSRSNNGNGDNETIVVATAVNQAAETGEVKGATTSTANLTTASNDDTVKNSNFMGLGWWWLPLLALLFGFFFIALGRRSDQK